MPRTKTETTKKTAKKTATKKEVKKAPKKSVAPVEQVVVAALLPPEPPPAPPPPPSPQLTEAQKIWEDIRQVQLNMFALPGQTVEMYCKVYPIEPSRVYMTVKVSAVLAALEDTLGKWYNFDTAGKFVLVTRK